MLPHEMSVTAWWQTKGGGCLHFSALANHPELVSRLPLLNQLAFQLEFEALKAAQAGTPETEPKP